MIFDFDPFTTYINKLRDAFGKLAYFFRDSYKGNTIGIIWNPIAFQPSKFKAADCAMKIPIHEFDIGKLKRRKIVSSGDKGLKIEKHSNNVMVWPNQAEILEEIKILGRGFIKSIKM